MGGVRARQNVHAVTQSSRTPIRLHNELSLAPSVLAGVTTSGSAQIYEAWAVVVSMLSR
jgi:hypothetical protein